MEMTLAEWDALSERERRAITPEEWEDYIPLGESQTPAPHARPRQPTTADRDPGADGSALYRSTHARHFIAWQRAAIQAGRNPRDLRSAHLATGIPLPLLAQFLENERQLYRAQQRPRPVRVVEESATPPAVPTAPAEAPENGEYRVLEDVDSPPVKDGDGEDRVRDNDDRRTVKEASTPYLRLVGHQSKSRPRRRS